MIDNKRIGISFFAKGDYDNAIKHLEQAIIDDINDPEIYYQLAVIYAGKREYEKALNFSDRAVALDPTYGGYHVNRGAILGSLGRIKEALQQYQLAVKLSPNSPVAHWNLAFEQLKYPRYWEEGWKNYAYRKLHSPTHYARSFLPAPPKGFHQNKDKVLLIHGEQGLGDGAFGMRFLKNLKQEFKKVHLEVTPALVNLFFGHPYIDDIFARPADGAFPYPEADYNMPMLDLVDWIGVKYKDLKNYAPPYLFPDEELVEAFKQQLPIGPNIGVCWHGSRTHANDCNRSIPCEMLEPVKNYGEVIALTTEPPTIDLLTGDSFLSDAKYTLALCASLDMVITVDTFIANLCGAANIPCMVLHPYVMEWRWHHKELYPSCINIRQKEIGNWETVVSEVCTRLEALK